MRRLNEKYIRMGREMEKSSGTFDPKGIWVRAWQIMLENHSEIFKNK